MYGEQQDEREYSPLGINQTMYRIELNDSRRANSPYDARSLISKISRSAPGDALLVN